MPNSYSDGRATDCRHAMDWERLKGSIKKYIADHTQSKEG